ncbi:hypothetical protein KFL_002760040 [Klebsormidium nitens]|uniref:Methylenetetrahydrofolate reductase (NAD(P)H) n=1 Tax=Klebsormidium nitens TaxID=105231 RepID=A0A1Y1IBU7_KLENI|nr:hypothetical protein KFL_002760040 [Klebsormidium nitens]|eukprot:GAQ86207.1 hypothetical protein KFL_002760040 [Klebsormidium nitens]
MAAARLARSCLAADKLPQGKLIRTLEVSQKAHAIIPELPQKQASWDQIWASGKFHATVMPDLPSIANLADLLPKLGAAPQERLAENLDLTEKPAQAPAGFFRVRTVAAQLKSRAHVSCQMQATATEISNASLDSNPVNLRLESKILDAKTGAHFADVSQRSARDGGFRDGVEVSDAGQSPGALLLVSGGHPVRRLPIVRNFLPMDAVGMLREGHRLKDRGLLPQGVQLWATENPLVNSVDSLERKLDARAEAIITQPPLLPDSFERWWSEADKRGLVGSTRLIVGLPFLSSLRNLDFWLMLTDATGSAEAEAVRGKWADHERRAGDHAGQQLDFRLQQTRECLRRIESLPGVQGVHLMPVTKRGWRDLLRLIDEGAFSS